LLIAYYSVSATSMRQFGVPRVMQALARYELRQVDDAASRASHAREADITTRAHLDDLRARIERSLHAANVVP